MRRLVVALLAGALSLSCVVYAQHPIRGELPLVLDPELAGAWRPLEDGKPDPSEEPWLFESHGDHYVLESKQDEIYEITTARLAGHRYLNVVEVGSESRSLVTLARYAMRDGKLTIAPMDYDAAKGIVEAGLLSGELNPPRSGSGTGDSEGGGSSLLVTASSAELEAYLLERGPFVLFPDGDAAELAREPAPARR